MSDRRITPRHFRRRYGQTLLELLVALAVIALIAIIAWPVFGGARERMAGRAVAQTLQSELRALRSRAVYEGEAEIFDLAPDGKRWRAAEGDWTVAPKGATVSFAGAASPGAAASIRFFADGSTTGGVILVTSGGRTWRIGVSLAGNVKLDEPLKGDQ